MKLTNNLRASKAPPAQAAEERQPTVTSGGSRNGLSGTGDRRPIVYREGSREALKLPSRMGDRLYYRDGRVEELK
jgi:hypothetical protein